jgi:uncharacterized protein (TIGR02611 family)
MDKIKRFWTKIPKPIRKTLVLILGSSIIITGLIMLIFPGPGWAAIFIGFAVLASEFAFAERARDWMIGQLERLLAFLKRRIKKLFRKK